MFQQPLTGLFLILWLAPVMGLMHSMCRQATHWLIGCFGSAAGYMMLSLSLDTSPIVPTWLDGLRWALFGAALYSFVRYRLSRRAQQKSDDQDKE